MDPLCKKIAVVHPLLPENGKKAKQESKLVYSEDEETDKKPSNMTPVLHQ